jgi:type I restriction enzyme, S subunit
MEALSSATTIAIVNKSKFRSVEIPIPSVAEQHQIVAEVESRTAAIDHLKAELDRQISRSYRLRQSVLTAAFAGNLI